MFVLLFCLYVLVCSGCLSSERLEEAQAPQSPVPLTQTAQSPLSAPGGPSPAPIGDGAKADTALSPGTTARPATGGAGPSLEGISNFFPGLLSLLDGEWVKAGHH